MTRQEDLTAAQRCLDDFDRAVTRLEQQVGSGLEIRRVRTDSSHLRESLTLLRESTPGEPPRPEIVTIPDAPYDATLWTDADDEGLGVRDRHAP